MTQTAMDLASAGERNPRPSLSSAMSYPFKRTPMDDAYAAAMARPITAEEFRAEQAMREFEDNLARSR